MPSTGEEFSMQFQFANSIKEIKTLSIIDGLAVTTGKLQSFKPASDVFRTNITLTGKLTKLQINGNFANDSSINATGPSGNIGDVIILGNLDGSITTTGRIKKIDVRGNINGSITGRQLDNLTVGGTLVNGGLTINGNAGNLNFANSLGAPGDTMTVNGNLKSLKVGTNTANNGATLALNLNVTGDLNMLDVSGQIDGNINAAGNINSVKVTADPGSSPTIMNGSITAGGVIKNAQFTNGSVAGNITAGSNIQKLLITNGSLAFNGSLNSNFGTINLLQIKNGNLNGNITANNGNNGKIQVTGNVGDGVNPLTVLFNNLAQFKVSLSVLSGVLVNIAGVLGDLNISNELASGATVMAGAINKQTIGVVNGNIIIG
jgi:hypothetical protein